MKILIFKLGDNAAKQKYNYNTVEDTMEETSKEKIDFDQWFALRSEQIPPQHHKEIILADFKGRKIAMESTIEEFDQALSKYGVILK